MGGLSPWHILLIAVVVLLVFGGRGKLSGLMGDAAKGIRAFRDGLKGDDEKPQPEAAAQPLPAPAAAPAVSSRRPESRGSRGSLATARTTMAIPPATVVTGISQGRKLRKPDHRYQAQATCTAMARGSSHQARFPARYQRQNSTMPVPDRAASGGARDAI